MTEELGENAYQDPSGIFWRKDEQTGVWRHFDGSNWVLSESQPPGLAPEATVPPSTVPETTLDNHASLAVGEGDLGWGPNPRTPEAKLKHRPLWIRRPVVFAGVGAVALAVVLIVVFVVAGSGGKKPHQTSATNETAQSQSTSPPATTPPNLKVTASGFTQLQPDSIGNSYFTYAAIVANPSASESATDVSLNLSFYDATGTIVDVDTETFRAILPGESVAIGDFAQGVGVTRMDAQATVGSWQSFSGAPGTFTFSNVSTTDQGYGDEQTTALMTSTFADAQTLVKVAAVYYNAAGSIIGGAFTFVDNVPAAPSSPVQVPVQVSGIESPPGIASTEVYASL